jgi:hypothetical protein
MNCGRLICKCNCGGFAQPLSVWVTDQKSLLVTCYCIVCESQVNVVFPLSDLWKSCPKPSLPGLPGKPIQPPLAKPPEELTEEDKKWLLEFHIKEPDNGV